MEIIILGTGCSKCQTLYERVKKVAEECQSTATIKKEEDITEIMKYNIMATPAIVIDGHIFSQGIAPDEATIKEWLFNNKTMELKDIVKQKYNDLALLTNAPQSCCCGSSAPQAENKLYTIMSEDYSNLKGYVADADLGVGCGLPTEFANIKAGDTVLDLGSGAGNDCFVARAETGETGKVIGIDFAPNMIEKARNNATKLGYKNMEFIEGDIEKMPINDNSIDVVVSNCVLNLLPEKDKIFKEIYRVLKPNGHFCISDVVLDGYFPKEFTDTASMYAGCIASAIQMNEYLGEIEKAEFSNIKVERTKTIVIPDDVLHQHLDEATIKKYKAGNVGIYSITVTGKKD